MELWHNQNYVYSLYGEENTEEIEDFKKRIDLIDKKAKELM